MPDSEINTGQTDGDAVAGTVGAHGKGVAVGQDIRQTTQTTNPYQRGGDNYFGAGSTEHEISRLWSQISVHSAQILELIIKMDDLPGRVRLLERTEVVIRPGPEVSVRLTPDTGPLSVPRLMTALVVGLVVVIGLVAFLIYFQAVRL